MLESEGGTVIVFELTIPHAASWNGKWSGADRRHIRIKRECTVPREIWGKAFDYCWDDGWGACVSVTKVPAREAHRLEKLSAGFSGYDWMIDSLIRRGYIVSESEIKAGKAETHSE